LALLSPREGEDGGLLPPRPAPCYDPARNEHSATRALGRPPVELGDAWVLRKGEKVARCLLVTNPFGWELRLMTTDLLRSQVCRSSTEVLDPSEQWQAAMVEKGWA
jgi:hypothetical protein